MQRTHTISLEWTRGERCRWTCTCGAQGEGYNTIGAHAQTDQTGPLTRQQTETLGRYNAEVARGIQHTAEWKARMAAWQERFNEHYLAHAQ